MSASEKQVGVGKKPRKAPKTLLERVVFAVEELAVPGGASRQAIGKHIEQGLEKKPQANAFKKALQQAVDSGKLEQEGQRFSIPGLTIEVPESERLQIETLAAGQGVEPAEAGQEVEVAYVGTLLSDGSKFDSASKFKFLLGAGEVIKGWDQGVVGMKVGEKRRLTVPSKLGYGARGSPPEIPGNSVLVFEITLLRLL